MNYLDWLFAASFVYIVCGWAWDEFADWRRRREWREYLKEAAYRAEVQEAESEGWPRW
ncbi:hypothetical protein UFOVP130_67 [uncultured Caudovirales phage]|uniref:Uncharacterized protein n=1 Tax=uncultured Caudovirales phage TaxID=2100421 RepID=A0A6J5L9J6_9CAUD|nr:hypothetical protein UFOVP130_67 [uncultured Caudovirales phage]